MQPNTHPVQREIFIEAGQIEKQYWRDLWNLISKVYFPRLIVPISAVVVSFFVMISGMILLGLMAWYNFVPSWKILLLLLFVLIAEDGNKLVM
jgi:hypothetical protein